MAASQSNQICDPAARFNYDGEMVIAEHNSSNVLQRRYVHGPGTDEPLLWYEGAGTTDRRWLLADELAQSCMTMGQNKRGVAHADDRALMVAKQGAAVCKPRTFTAFDRPFPDRTHGAGAARRSC